MQNGINILGHRLAEITAVLFKKKIDESLGIFTKEVNSEYKEDYCSVSLQKKGILCPGIKIRVQYNNDKIQGFYYTDKNYRNENGSLNAEKYIKSMNFDVSMTELICKYPFSGLDSITGYSWSEKTVTIRKPDGAEIGLCIVDKIYDSTTGLYNIEVFSAELKENGLKGIPVYRSSEIQTININEADFYEAVKIAEKASNSDEISNIKQLQPFYQQTTNEKETVKDNSNILG